MTHTTTIGKTIYSVDMMIAYVRLNSLPKVRYQVQELADALLSPKGWGQEVKYSALDVIARPNEYKEDYDRIQNANLRFPIFMTSGGQLLDGVHRIAKAAATGRKTLSAYVFDPELLKKFIVNRRADYQKVYDMNMHDFITMYVERFAS